MTQASLKEQLKALEHLQEIDLKIDSLKKNKNALPAQLKALDDNLTKIRGTVDGKNNAVAEIEKNQRQTQAALELNKDRLTRSTSRLESVQNSQEFQAVQKEIETLNKMNTTLTDQLKKFGQDFEAAKAEVATASEQMAKVQQERDGQATVVSGQTAQFDGDIASLTSNRAQFTSRVEPRILSQYDRVRVARAGIGIVPAVGGRCKGCNMMVPPQLFNQIQRGNELHQCPSCHRILFVPDQTPSAG